MPEVNWNNKDKRIAYESILRTFIGSNGVWGKTNAEVNAIRDLTIGEVDFLFDQYPTTPPTDEEESLPRKVYSSKPLTNDQYQGNDSSGSSCPSCNIGNIVKKSGKAKSTGKPYSFYGCDQFPRCKYVAN